MLLIGTGEEKQIKDTPWTFEIFLGCMDLLVSSRVCWLKGCLFYRFNIYIYMCVFSTFSTVVCIILHFYIFYLYLCLASESILWLQQVFFIFLYIVGCSISL